MIHSGLVSITFRKLSAEQIIELVVRAGLEGIEWGGDVHVPHGDLARAREVRRRTADAGLVVPAYGSYYRAGPAEPCEFAAVLDTAVELGAPVVRVWAGKKGSADADEAYRGQVVADSRRIADRAAEAGLTVAYEFHGHTLTDTNASAVRLLDEVARDNVRCYWQPAGGMSPEERLAGLRALLDRLCHLHVFAWHEESNQRMPLADGRDQWLTFLRAAAGAAGRRERFALLEFVRNDDPAAFLEDAPALKHWLAAL